jgi:hypothetical protein
MKNHKQLVQMLLINLIAGVIPDQFKVGYFERLVTPSEFRYFFPIRRIVLVTR